MAGHAGVHTAAPSAATMDWDLNRSEISERHIQEAVTLWTLDWPVPPDVERWVAGLDDVQ